MLVKAESFCMRVFATVAHLRNRKPRLALTFKTLAEHFSSSGPPLAYWRCSQTLRGRSNRSRNLCQNETLLVFLFCSGKLVVLVRLATRFVSSSLLRPPHPLTTSKQQMDRLLLYGGKTSHISDAAG